MYYAGSTFGTIFRGPSGAGWTNAFAHPAGLSVTDIEIDADSPAIIHASFAGTAFGRVFRLVKSLPVAPTSAAQNITSDH